VISKRLTDKRRRGDGTLLNITLDTTDVCAVGLRCRRRGTPHKGIHEHLERCIDDLRAYLADKTGRALAKDAKMAARAGPPGVVSALL
jgi:hypothetical protein